MHQTEPAPGGRATTSAYCSAAWRCWSRGRSLAGPAIGDVTGSTVDSYLVGPRPYGPVSIAAGDVDADGDVDLVTANFDSDAVSVLLNDGQGQFSQALDMLTICSSWSGTETRSVTPGWSSPIPTGRRTS